MLEYEKDVVKWMKQTKYLTIDTASNQHYCSSKVVRFLRGYCVSDMTSKAKKMNQHLKPYKLKNQF